MKVITEIRPGHAVRRPQPKRYDPSMLRNLVPAYEGDEAQPFQVRLEMGQRAKVRMG